MRRFILLKNCNDMRRMAWLCVFLLSFHAVTAFSQGVAVSGTVIDSNGEPLVGASVVVPATGSGTVTDIDGEYTLDGITPDAVLRFSFVGYTAQDVIAGSQRVINVTLTEDSQSLEELVVVGYGVQRKALVTGATINVQGDELQKMSTSNPLTALQAQSPGVTIMQSNGQPGSDYIVNIRGVGTNGEARPLYVVDGIPSGFNALNSMNVADIESIDILKDAASSAIYGARAANGVVLITTKQGKAGKARVTYDAYFGKQYMTKKPDMLNAKEYMQVQDEISFNMGLPYYDWPTLLGDKWWGQINSGEWEGSDWVDAFYNKGAAQQNHAMNITGGNDMSKFSMGYSYSTHDGLLGEKAQPNFTRHTVRLNSDHVLLRVKDFDAIKFGENISYMFRQSNALRVGDRFGNDFHGVITANPMLPIYNTSGNNHGYYGYLDKVADKWAFDENAGNPIGETVLGPSGNGINKNHNFNASAFLQIQPIKNLIFMSRYSYRFDATSTRRATMPSYFGRSPVTAEEVAMSQNMGFQWSVTNTLTYSFSVREHNFVALVGQEAERSGYGENITGESRNNIFDLGFDYSWLDNMKATVLDEVEVRGGPRTENAMSSFFGRVGWNLRDTYMAEAIIRADGSSRFASGHRWGYFPAFSAGWVISNESFMEGTRNFLNYLKLRGSWGQNGNAEIEGFQYLSRYSYPTNGSGDYIFSEDKKVRSPGAIPGVLMNPNIRWETSQSFNIGFDSRFVRNRLGVVFDYYVKDTKDWLLRAPISATWGFSEPYVNGGAVRNTGLELTFNWNDRAGDFTYGINLNGSWNKNEVTQINNAEGIIKGPENVISQTTGEVYRLQVGHPMGFFYGWKHDGIFQNWDEVNAYVNKEGELIQPTAQPGDVRFRDVNGDGMISVDDKTEIGCGWPVFMAGLTFNADYKGFDMVVTASGKFGHQIIKSYRSFAASNNANYTTEVFKRWTGEGTSDRWPRLTHGNNPNYQQVSDLFVESGNFVKVQNITLGYDLTRLLPQLPFSRLRAYVTGQNLFVITKYSGMDPEVGFGHGQSWVSGIDIGLFPSAKTYMFGLNVTF